MIKHVARGACVALALLAIGWSIRFTPLLAESRMSGLEMVGRRLAVLDTYEPEFLKALDAASASHLERSPCLPLDLESLVLVRGADAGVALLGLDETVTVVSSMRKVEDAAHLSLRCNPYSSMSWVMLAWAKMFEEQRDTKGILRDLDMSYRTGPREFATVVRRLELWLQLWEDLDESEKERVWGQIHGLIRGDQRQVVMIFYFSANEDAKAFLEERFASLDAPEQNMVGHWLRREGVDISLPLMDPEGDRPWR